MKKKKHKKKKTKTIPEKLTLNDKLIKIITRFEKKLGRDLTHYEIYRKMSFYEALKEMQEICKIYSFSPFFHIFPINKALPRFITLFSELTWMMYNKCPGIKVIPIGFTRLITEYFKILRNTYIKKTGKSFFYTQVSSDYAIQNFLQTIHKKYSGLFEEDWMKSYFQSFGIRAYRKKIENDNFYVITLGENEFKLNEEQNENFLKIVREIDEKIAKIFLTNSDKKNTLSLNMDLEEVVNGDISKLAALYRYKGFIDFFPEKDCALAVGKENFAKYNIEKINILIKKYELKVFKNKNYNSNMKRKTFSFERGNE